MIFWGSGHKNVQKKVDGNFICAGCGRANELSVLVEYDYSHIYWIFKSVKNVKTFLVCQNCDHVQIAEDQTKNDLFEALGGNPIPFTDRFGGVVLLLIIVGLGAYAILSQPHRDSSGVIDRSGRLGAFDMQIGDCFNDPNLDNSGAEIKITGLYVVPCAEPHDNEVFAVFNLKLETFPEDNSMSDIAANACLQQFEQFVGRDYETSSLDITTVYPTRQSWTELRDREVVCALYDVDQRKLEGSMEGSGT